MVKLFIAFLIIILIIRLYMDHNLLKISNFSIKSSKIGKNFDGFRILQLSDLHSKSFGKNNHRLVEKIDTVKPDIIVFTGDAVNGVEDDYLVFFNLVEQLVKRYPFYFVRGNHEDYLPKEKQKAIVSFLKDNHVIVLDNEKEELKKGEDKINLYGLWGNLKYYHVKNMKSVAFTEIAMQKMMRVPNAEQDVFNILLAHNPNFMDVYAKWGADLVFSGHIHGGMIRLPLIGGVFSPDRKFFPKYSKGKYNVNGKELIVSTGLDKGMRGFRLFNRPQINVVTLHSGEDAKKEG